MKKKKQLQKCYLESTSLSFFLILCFIFTSSCKSQELPSIPTQPQGCRLFTISMFSVVNVDLIGTIMSFTRSLHNGISFSKTPKKLASRFKGKNNSPLNPIQTCYFSPGQNIHTSTPRASFLFVMLKEQFKRIVSFKMWMKFKYCGGGGWGSFVFLKHLQFTVALL